MKHSTHDLIAGYCSTCQAPVRLFCSDCGRYMYKGEAHKAGWHSDSPIFYCQCASREVMWSQRPHRWVAPATTEQEFPFTLGVTRKPKR